MSKKDKFAVVLIGTQNSGKTTTIKHFDTMYDALNRKKKQCKAGWRQLVLHRGILDSLVTWIFFIPASPTETKKTVRERVGGYRPELMLIAEQIYKGEEDNKYSETMNFLNSEGYEMIEIVIGDDATETLWRKWDDATFEETMKKRSIAIGNLFREFIKRKVG